MAIIGFIAMFLGLLLFTAGIVFVSVFDGAFGGKREIPIWAIILIMLGLVYGWIMLVTNAPFTITLT